MVCASQMGHQDFIKFAKSICQEKEYSIIYVPYELQGKLWEKFKNALPTANIILMDVTPEKYRDSENKSCYITNQGVLIEFGCIIADEDYSKLLYIFCENNKRKKTHPYVINETIDEYSKNNLKDKILEKIRDRLKKIPAENREFRKQFKDLKENR